jgi:hypothetical protein
MSISTADYGNLHFGYVGRVTGLTADDLRGISMEDAKHKNPTAMGNPKSPEYIDEMRDQGMITRGAAMYDTDYSGTYRVPCDAYSSYLK